MTIICGVDIGSVNLGVCVYDTNTKQVVEVMDVTADSTNYPKVEHKIQHVYNIFSTLFNKHNVEVFVYEEFIGSGTTASAIYQVLGGIKLAAINNKISLLSYTATNVKKIVTGNGKADKADIAKAVNSHFNLQLPYTKKSQTHKTDSLGVLYCYLYNQGLL